MKKELQKIESSEVINAEFPIEVYTDLRAFNEKIIYASPSKKWIKKNNGLEYIPIRIVETLLRSVFGTYQVEMIGQPHVIGNSVVVSVNLKVFHPLFREWLNYSGTGAVPIQLRKGTNDPLDFSKINPTALQRNIPAAKAYAISNAAKSIGKIFGAELNNGTDEVWNLMHPEV